MNELSELIHAAFATEPLPSTYWLDGVDLLSDIPRELANRITTRPWVDVTMLDWTMTGAHAATARNYFDADAFRYYLPSLLIGGLNEIGFVDWPLECLLPAGKNRRTTGKWWQAFSAGFSVEQTNVVKQYLIGARQMLDKAVHLSELHLIGEAQAIWGS